METTPQTTTPAAVALQRDVCDDVLARVNKLQNNKMLALPKDYAVENHLKSAWLVLQETLDRNKKPVLESCTRVSVANCLFDMVLQGLSAQKKQCYFIAYGNKLTLIRSYFGTVALAKRAAHIQSNPIANVVYAGDEFLYEIDPTTGLTRIVKHVQQIGNIDMAKIVGAYAIVKLEDGTTQVTIMSMPQIISAWAQGQGYGTSKTHTNFTDEMCKKTVINRACKMLINSSNDSWLYEGKADESDSLEKERQQIVEDAEIANAAPLPEPKEYTEVTPATAQPQAQAPAAEQEPQNKELFGNDPY